MRETRIDGGRRPLPRDIGQEILDSVRAIKRGEGMGRLVTAPLPDSRRGRPGGRSDDEAHWPAREE